jgi:23S rRNA G2445 N2-methylase RlmL
MYSFATGSLLGGIMDGGIELLGTTKDLYNANYWLRVASRILVC